MRCCGFGRYPAEMGFQIIFVDVPDRFPVQLNMPCDVGSGHDLAQAVDLYRQALRAPCMRVIQLPILGADTLAVGTEQFTARALQPDLGGGKVQIAHLPPDPTVDGRGLPAALMADRLKPRVRSDIHDRIFRGLVYRLADNVDSTKWEMR